MLLVLEQLLFCHHLSANTEYEEILSSLLFSLLSSLWRQRGERLRP